MTTLRLQLVAVSMAIAAAMAIAGPAESSLDRSCSSHQPNPSVTCRQW